MKRNVLLSSIALLTFISVFSVNAQTVTPEETETTDEVTTTKTTTAPGRANETVQLKRSELREATAARRQEIQAEMEAKREAFQDSIEEVKDVRKQALIERFDEKISGYNKNHTTKLLGALTRMEGVLEKIATKAATADTAGEDVTDLEEAIEEAQTAIEEAKILATDQSEMDYVVSFEDEDNVRVVAQQVFTQFRTDLKEVHEAVKAAHMAVVAAARELANVKIDAMVSEDDEEETETEESATDEAETAL